MIIAEDINTARANVKRWHSEGLTVGLVPTMGFLHEGHLSLVNKAASLCDKVAVSIFVNPTQFAAGEDLDTYPRDFARDCSLLSGKCDMVFHPEAAEMYTQDAATYVTVENDMPKFLCGLSRPTHFKGVCTVVAKLFNIIQPDKAFFGQKDAQQFAIIKKMARDLSYDIDIISCPIVREADGLAKSSRNKYLNPTERKAAVILSSALKDGLRLIAEGETSSSKIIASVKKIIESEPLAKIDYVEIVDKDNLKRLDTAGKNSMIAIAVYIGKTRLIDNATVGGENNFS